MSSTTSDALGQPRGDLAEHDSRLYNKDLAPTTPAQRTWGTYNYIALWFSMSMEVTTYMLASSLIAGGMNWKQAILTILLGNLIVLVPMLLNAHAGAKYGIPFPVFVRASFGTRGANIPAMLRAIVACGWFGIQSWLGGQAIAAMIAVLWPATAHMPSVLWASFLGFWLLNMYVVWRGVESIRFLQSFSAPFMLVMSLILLFWMLHKAGGFGPMLAAPSRFQTTGSFLRFFFPSLTAMVGYWATLSLNIPDFTRYAKSQDSQIAGQAFGLPVAMVLYSFIGIACTSASVTIFGEPMWSPITLLGRFHQPLAALLGVSCAAGRDAQCKHWRECRFSLERLLQPRSGVDQFSHGWLDYGFVGARDDAVEADEHLWQLHLRMAHRLLGIAWTSCRHHGCGLFSDSTAPAWIQLRCIAAAVHTSTRAASIRGRFVALVAGVVVALIGLAVPALRFLYDYAWFVGFFLAGGNLLSPYAAI